MGEKLQLQLPKLKLLKSMDIMVQCLFVPHPFISPLIIKFMMKKLSSTSTNKENIHPTLKSNPLQYNCFPNKKKNQSIRAHAKAKASTRRSIATICTNKHYVDLPHIFPRDCERETRRKLYTEIQHNKEHSPDLYTLFKRKQNRSIDKQLERLQSLHSINKTLRKELGDLDTIVLNMSLKKLIKPQTQKCQQIKKRRL